MVRIAVLHKDRCNPAGCGNYACMKASPLNRQGIDYITIGDDGKPVIHEELTNDACQICASVCPFGAISLVKLPEELGGKRIHRYGKNGFSLYSLPMPKFEQVVGILGKNAIGKSTVIQVLAGVLKPNLGNLETEASADDLIRFFKGSENQKFFELIKEGDVKISYKPQHVSHIPKTVSGTVRELLENVDEKKELESVSKKVDITHILDNNIKTVSGGELQRVAIAAAVLKKANLYVFDEPTSYLDIKQRLKISQFIRELATEGTAILVVEHDLIVLDFLTDFVHIMYGKEDVYGVTSMIRPGKRAINAFLDGFLREENMRIRPNKIAFEAKAPIDHKSTNLLISWEGIKKQLGSFSLEATEGAIHKKEIVGVLGGKRHRQNNICKAPCRHH